jgi:hypothetical protein
LPLICLFRRLIVANIDSITFDDRIESWYAAIHDDVV